MTRTPDHQSTKIETNRAPIADPRRPWLAISVRVVVPLLAACVWLSVAPGARAQTGESGVPAAVASVLDEQTVALIEVDTKRFDLDAAVTQVSAIPVLSMRQREDLAIYKRQLSNWLNLFHQRGGRDIWIVVTLADDLQNSVFLVVPLHEGADPRGLEGLMVAGKLTGPKGTDYPFLFSDSLERNGGLIIGSDQTLKRLREFNGPLRVVPQEALESVAGAEIRAFVLPTSDQRRVLSEFLRDPSAERAMIERMPRGTVPAEFLRDPAELSRLALTDGLQWLAAGVSAHDTLDLKVVIGSKDATSAQALALWIGGVFQFAKESVAAEKSSESQMIAALIERFSRLLAPKVEGNRLTVRVDLKQFTAGGAGAFFGQAAVGMARKAESNVIKNHLKQLSLAMHNYHDVYRHFPPAAIRDAHGRPLLSWRVSLLPFLNENELYKQFHLDEPWDSAHNKPLIARLPETFSPDSPKLREEGKTTLLVPVGKQTIFGPKDGIRIRDITDGTTNTILIVNADWARGVEWTRPEDLNVDGVDAKQILFGSRKDGFAAAFADGSVRFIGPNFSSDVLHALLTRNGGEPVAWPENH
ncbi:MAG TPA: DUF1559 domain-containing protein [Planctomycetaceae bacterium]|jgi:hypothetical protein|nr:DUF1559 domain-containing protein [Planctomycetaceae bacterium]